MTEKKKTTPPAKKAAQGTKKGTTPRKPRTSKKKAGSTKKPAWINKGVTEFVTGTEHYRELVTEANKILGTNWNPWRCRPAVFYTLWQEVRKHYGVE